MATMKPNPIVAAGTALVLCLAFAGMGRAQPLTPRIAFQISTGPTGGTYFPAGEAIAGLISHPMGAQRCDKSMLCGPAGLIASARTSEGTTANIAAVESGAATSGLAQADVVTEAIKGIGAFKKQGPAKHLRVIAALFPEDVHLVVATSAQIAGIPSLKNKRVALGAESSGTLVTARAILNAYRIRERNLKASFDAPDIAAQKMERKELDAFFFVGGTPVPLVQSLIARGLAKLAPIDGEGRTRLLKSMPALASDVIPANTYPGTGKIETVKSRAVWIVNDAQPQSLVYEITRALFESGNAQLLQANQSTGRINIETAARDLPAPLHPGAEKFYRERGKLTR